MTLDLILSIDPFNWQSVGAALFCGSIIGFERQLRGKPVGIRTSSLIVLGTYIFVASSSVVSNHITDPSRIIGQVVTGIGFLGAGVMLAKEGLVVGATSAATIWALAAIGVCISVVDELVAIKMSVIVVIILFGLDSVEQMSSSFTRGLHSRFKTWCVHKADKRWDDLD